MARFFRLIFQLAFFAILAAMIGLAGLLLVARKPIQVNAPQLVMIERGLGTLDIISRFSREGYTNKYAMLLVTVLKGEIGGFKAGEYEITAGMNTFDMVGQLARGDVYKRTITIPEGYTVGDVLRLLQQTETLSGDVAAPPQEGRLLPETYAYTRGDSRQGIVNRMVKAMDNELAKVWAQKPTPFLLDSPEELLTLASIVEKETGVVSERPLVASVFLNRLKAGMKLQSDPTVIYALTKGQAPLGRLLTTKDLEKTDSPYNTYMYDGLPPSAIANPGRDALMAVIKPAVSDYFYFVADGTGGHKFARTLKDHNDNVANWRRVQRAAP